MKFRTFFSAFFLIMLFSDFCFAQEETTFVKVNDSVPVFEFEKTPGKKTSISDLKGKTVLITFFATWCGPCRKELPRIQSDVYNKYRKNPNFELLIFGREHSWEEIEKFSESNKFTMPMYPDPERKIYSQFAGQYIPRNFLVSAEGKVIYNSIGFDEKEFKKMKELIDYQLKSN
jgi:peroxiredoxin